MLCFAETSSAQDIIVLDNDAGDELEVKVVEVSDYEVRYKKWSYQDGPIFTITTDKIFVIKYQNGDKQRFDAAPTTKVSKTKQSKNKKNKVKSANNKSNSNNKSPKKSNKKGKQNSVTYKTYKSKDIKPVVVPSSSKVTKTTKPVTKSSSTSVKVKQTPQPKISNNKDYNSVNPFEKGYTTGGIRFIYCFADTEYPKDMVKRSSNYIVELCSNKYVMNNVYVGVGLGCHHNYVLGEYKSNIDDSITHLTLPFVTGYTIPLSNNFWFDLSTGPRLLYRVAGKINDVKYKDLPDEIRKKLPKSFGANWDFMAKINFGGYVSIGGMYTIVINKSNKNANGVWGLSLTLGF